VYSVSLIIGTGHLFFPTIGNNMGSNSERFYGLDHLRAVAIVLVLLFHYEFYYGIPKWLSTFSSFGWSGVDGKLPSILCLLVWFSSWWIDVTPNC
jgi:Na+/proline symporter